MSPSPEALTLPSSSLTPSPWAIAVRLLVRWIDHQERADTLLETVPSTISRADRGRVQHLFYGALRHLGRIEAHLTRWVARPPRTRLRAVLLVAGFELIEGGAEGHVARVVHHAVEQAKTLASPAEAKLVNAVVRKMAESISLERPPGQMASAEVLAEYFSHPVWMVKRWIGAFGLGSTRKLLESHQRPAALSARWRKPEAPLPAWLEATPIAGFYQIASGHWKEVEAELEAGHLYLQDPATRHAVDLLEVSSGETVLDACAAPGGKALSIADRMKTGRLVVLDLPGPRLNRLQANLARVQGVETVLVAADLQVSLFRALQDKGLPVQYSAVLIDVPCSNTGVMRHRVDVKWRLQEGDIFKHSRQQGALLRAAAALVAPGGRLVYSTCSIDSLENEHVVSSFLQAAGGGWTQEAAVISRPWETGHDGAAAFRLRRAAVA